MTHSTRWRRASNNLSKEVSGRRANLLALMIALALGQGILVIVFLALAVKGKADLVGEFSLGFQVASLALFASDFGGSLSLSRMAASRMRNARGFLPRSEFAVLLTGRAIISLFAFVALIWTGTSGIYGAYSSAFLLAAAPSVLLQIFNLAGALDGVGRAGIAGISNSLYFLLPAFGLIYQASSSEPSGFLLGALFTLGVFGSVASQHTYARLSGCLQIDMPGTLRRVSLFLDRGQFRSSLKLFLYMISGQVLSRGQIIIAGLFFASDILGAIAIAKQIANGASQVIGLFRRVEFPRLVQHAKLKNGLTVVEGIRLQATGTFVAIGFSLIFCTFLFLPATLLGETRLSFILLATHAPALITTALLAGATQTSIAMGQTNFALLTSAFTTLFTLIGVWIICNYGKFHFLFIIEAVLQIIALIFFIVYFRRRQQY